jgi:hypothetical protein
LFFIWFFVVCVCKFALEAKEREKTKNEEGEEKSCAATRFVSGPV